MTPELNAARLERIPPAETIMPEQSFADVRALGEPERRLRLAVLEDALLDCQQYPFGRRRHGHAVYQDATDWFASPDRTEPFSFENVCEALGLDPDSVRSRLRRWHTAQRAAALGYRPTPRSTARAYGVTDASADRPHAP